MNCRKICGKDEYHRFLETPNGLLAVSKNKIAEANKVGANSKELLAILTLLQEQEVKLGDVNNITEPANKSKSYLQEKPEQNADIEKIKEVGFD